MKLEDQVCSFESAKRLEELGVKQESLFYFLISKNKAGYSISYLAKSFRDNKNELSEIYSAFTVAELGEMLPWFIENDNKKYWYSTGKTRKNDKYYEEHEVHYSDNETTPCLKRGTTEADARAKMLIYLLESNLMVL